MSQEVVRINMEEMSDAKGKNMLPRFTHVGNETVLPWLVYDARAGSGAAFVPMLKIH